jgi:glycosyltransferase involved in cell wall biosynthesis
LLITRQGPLPRHGRYQRDQPQALRLRPDDAAGVGRLDDSHRLRPTHLQVRRRGWTPHLFLVGTGSAQLLAEFRDTFETITVIEPWQLCQPDYLLGLLGTMDVVVNNLCTLANEVSSLLRRHGVMTICHLHSVIISPDQMPCGQVYDMLRYEHSYDGVIVISQKLQSWCRAWGVPHDKLIYAPNAPSFEISDAFLKMVMEIRSERELEPEPGDRLNVLYLGRFDWEKGMDRLLAICDRTRQESLPVNWRVVGGRVCGTPGSTDRDLESIKEYVQPPIMTASGLSRLYSWADVVIMVSRFEGVPLTILEAQQHGCVVLSTRVGAIDEIVEDGRTGFLFSNDLDTPALVEKTVTCLSRLQANRGRLLEIARTGAALRRHTTWSVNSQALAHFVESRLLSRRIK